MRPLTRPKPGRATAAFCGDLMRAGSVRPGTAADCPAGCPGTRWWSNVQDREPRSPFDGQVAKHTYRRSDVITLPRRHALGTVPRSSPRQVSALHPSPSLCPTFCGKLPNLRNCHPVPAIESREYREPESAVGGDPPLSVDCRASGRSTHPCPRRTTTRSRKNSAKQKPAPS